MTFSTMWPALHDRVRPSQSRPKLDAHAHQRRFIVQECLGFRKTLSICKLHSLVRRWLDLLAFARRVLFFLRYKGCFFKNVQVSGTRWREMKNESRNYCSKRRLISRAQKISKSIWLRKGTRDKKKQSGHETSWQSSRSRIIIVRIYINNNK